MIVYLSLGSNLGEREDNIRSAIQRLQELPDTLFHEMSRITETEPWGYTRQPQFLNCAAKIETGLSADDLLEACLEIEKQLGRKREIRWGPRVIDIDIIFYGDRVIQKERLRIPHIHAHERKFVLEPLAELDPGFRHPVLGMSIRELLNRLTS